MRRGVQPRRRPGKQSCSILEAFERIAALTGRPFDWGVRRQEPRRRPHLLHQRPSKAPAYPAWDLTKSLDDILVELWRARSARAQKSCLGYEETASV